MKTLWALVTGTLLLLCGCQTAKDYTEFIKHQPRSILVLPPLNESVDIAGTYGVYSSVTKPIAEMRYYVFPVTEVDLFLKENGVPAAEEMHQVSLAKFREIFGADAVLYLTVKS